MKHGKSDESIQYIATKKIVSTSFYRKWESKNYLNCIPKLEKIQGWEFAHLLIAHSLIAHSLSAHSLIAHSLIAHLLIAHSLISLKSNE